jgi:hypothetical protein
MFNNIILKSVDNYNYNIIRYEKKRDRKYLIFWLKLF